MEFLLGCRRADKPDDGDQAPGESEEHSCPQHRGVEQRRHAEIGGELFGDELRGVFEKEEHEDRGRESPEESLQ